MKAVNVIVKVVIALAAVAGIVYIAATYGDKIVAWAKNLLGKCRCCCGDDCQCDCDCDCDECDCEGDCNNCDCCCPCDEEAPAEVEADVSEQDFEG